MAAMAAGMGLNHVSSRALKRAEKELSQTKVIVRRLPPDFTEEKFKEVINPLPANNMFYFFPGDQSLGKFGCARAYINFAADGDIVHFRDKYDGMMLQSQKGTKYRAVIEYAPFQGVPRRNKKPDPRCGTIEQDAEYKEFLEDYEKGAAPLPSIDVSYLEHLEASRVPQVAMTPLVEFIKEKRAPKPKKNKVIYAADSKRKRDKEKKTKDGESRGKSAGKDRGKGTEKVKGGHSSRKTDKERTKKQDWEVKSQSEDGATGEFNSTHEPSKKQTSQTPISGHEASKGEVIQPLPDEKVHSKLDRDGSGSARSEKEKPRRSKGRPDQQIYVPKGARRQGADSKDKESSTASSRKELARSSSGREHSTKESRSEHGKPKSAALGGHRYNDRYGSSRDYQFNDYHGDDYRRSGGRRGQSRRDHDSSYDYWDDGGGDGYDYEDLRKDRSKASRDGPYRRGRDYSRGYYQGSGSSGHSKSSRSYK